MLFHLTRIQALGLMTTVLVVLVGSLGLRYRVIEPVDIGRACEVTGANSLCALRRVAQVFAHYSVFGGVALVAAVLHFMRPALSLCVLGFLAASAGLVLYNTPVSACAFTLLLLGFARGMPETE